MIATVQTINRSTYTMDKGEKIPMHAHDYMHNTRVLTGRSWVEVKGIRSFGMSSADVAYELPANIPHEITAMIDGTIVINEFEPPELRQPGGAPDLPRAGVLMADGTVAYP